MVRFRCKATTGIVFIGLEVASVSIENVSKFAQMLHFYANRAPLDGDQ